MSIEKNPTLIRCSNHINASIPILRSYDVMHCTGNITQSAVFIQLQDTIFPLPYYLKELDPSRKILMFGTVLEVIKKNILTFKAPNKNCSRQHFNFLFLSLEENKA